MNSRILLGAIDQSTTSTKFQIFDTKGNLVVKQVKEHTQITPFSGWLEHDPLEILMNLKEVMQNSLEDLVKLNIPVDAVQSIGVTNQRETTVAWNKKTGQPYMNAIVWSDTRTTEICHQLLEKYNGNINYHKHITGLPINTYFSAFKIQWMLKHCETLKNDIKHKLEEVCIGTIDSWVLWNLLQNQQHFTDVSNASRTFLLNLKTLKWDDNLLNEFNIPKQILPEVKPSGYNFGAIAQGPFKGCTINSVLGDQMAACIGHGLFQAGKSKNTYGTGLFLLANIGQNLRIVNDGLLTSVLYQRSEDSKPVYVFEGAVECGGSTINWARDQMNLFKSYEDLDKAIQSVQNSDGVYFVPAFSGLYSPYWNEYATGTILGLTLNTKKEHILRAIFDAICYRTRDVIDLMEHAGGVKIDTLNVDGGITNNKFLMQLQADTLQKNISKPFVTDSTCLGIALFAGLNKGVFQKESELSELIGISEKYYFNDQQGSCVDKCYQNWKKAIQKSLDWLK